MKTPYLLFSSASSHAVHAPRSGSQQLIPLRRSFHQSSPSRSHENPLGLPRSLNSTSPPPSSLPPITSSQTLPPTRKTPGPRSSFQTSPPLPQKRKIPNVKHVVVVSSGKGGVGKSTVAANLAVALGKRITRKRSTPSPQTGPAVSDSTPPFLTAHPTRPLRVGILDLDIFGPSIPKLFDLERAGAPELTRSGPALTRTGDVNANGRGNRLIPLRNHGVGTMSVGYLLPPSANSDEPIAWRGLMVMKAVQQLLFDVDWGKGAEGRSQAIPPAGVDARGGSGGVMGGFGKAMSRLASTLTGVGSKIGTGDQARADAASSTSGDPGTDSCDAPMLQEDEDLDILVIDMPPGTGDVQLTLGQLVVIDGAVIISTPQSVALVDARKGVNMFRKLHIPIIGAVLNQSHYVCECCGDRKELFGSSEAFERVGREMDMDVLARIPIVPSISTGGDAGLPIMAESEWNEPAEHRASDGEIPVYSKKGLGWRETREAFGGLADQVLRHLRLEE